MQHGAGSAVDSNKAPCASTRAASWTIHRTHPHEVQLRLVWLHALDGGPGVPLGAPLEVDAALLRPHGALRSVAAVHRLHVEAAQQKGRCV